MAKKFDKMDLHLIRSMHREGMSQKNIAYVMECSQSAISRVLDGSRGEEVDQIADRMEYFLPDSPSEWDNPVFDQVAFEEELEQFLTKLEEK